MTDQIETTFSKTWCENMAKLEANYGDPDISVGLFSALPAFPVPLPSDELRLLTDLPLWEAVQAVPEEQEAACRRLEKRGLVKVHRWKDDTIAIKPTMYAGRLP